jgi:hypothetical protein
MIACVLPRAVAQEIAAHSKLPLGTVKAHIRRALELPRHSLGRDGERDVDDRKEAALPPRSQPGSPRRRRSRRCLTARQR